MLEIEILKTVKITTILIIKMDDYFLNKLLRDIKHFVLFCSSEGSGGCGGGW